MEKVSTNNAQSIMKNKPSLKLAITIWLLGSLFYLYENVLQVSPGVMVPDVMSALSINSALLGSLIAFFFYSYSSMQIPVGVLVDNFNARYLLTGAVLSCVIGCALFATATHFFIAALGRLLIGFGAAFAAVCTMKLAANWFPRNQFPLLVGLMITLGMIGSILGEKPLAILVEQIGWRHSLLILAGIGLVLAVLVFFVIHHSPKTLDKHTKFRIKDKKSEHSILSGLLQVLKCSQSWILAVYGGLMFATTSIFGGLWGVPFLIKAYDLSRPTAAGAVSVLFLGWVIGGPLSGVLVNLLGSYKKILWVSSLGSLTVLLIVLYRGPFPVFVLSILMFLFGLFSSFFLPSFSLIHDIHTAKNSGAALGFMNTANMLGGALGQPLIGILLDLNWDGTLVNNVRDYSLSNYQYSLSCLPMIIAASILLLPFIKERSRDHL